jgi:A/G-specific adenine glycosylase
MGQRNPAKVKYIHKQLLRWYHHHQRELSWRKTRDPYAILVSEIMLQQTQVQRVQLKLREFIKQFPTIRKLAHAPVADVIRVWRGMGYNRRAVHLQKLASIVVKEYDGKIPSDPESLRLLPGIGKYTAYAVACFAFGHRVPVVEVNVRRVLSRYFWKMNDVSSVKPENEIWKIAEEILPRNASDWNQGLMDLGATICTRAKTRCESCPLKTRCSSKHLEMQARTNKGTRSEKSSEPMYDGIPIRLWRGKIVEVLRDVPAERSLGLRQIGTKVKKNFHVAELSWLTKIINRLIEDGILERIGTGATMKVRLATR